MDEALWKLFWTTGLPEAYALAKEGGEEIKAEPSAGRNGQGAPLCLPAGLFKEFGTLS